jgi:retinol-binding protein 3
MKIKTLAPTVILAAICFGAAAIAVAQSNSKGKKIELSPAGRKEIVENVAEILDKYYVFPDKGKAMSEMLKSNLANRVYEGVADPNELKRRLLVDLQKFNLDPHLNIAYIPPNSGFHFVSDFEPKTKEREEEIKKFQAEEARTERANNFGLSKVEILEGNIGYLRIDGFQAQPDSAGSALAAAMKFLENTDAIIIDVRRNHGGNPDYVALVESYFFDGDPVLLDTIYSRPSNTTRELWSVKDVGAGRPSGRKLFVLTSASTGSGGEMLPYDLQSFKKATIVGETTLGGAHQMSPYPIVGDFGVFAVMVPDGRVVNAVTKSNWEAVGVKPDVPAPAEKALAAAHKLALEHVIEATTDQRIKSRNASIVAKLSFQEKPRSEKDETDLSQFVGLYREREITLDQEGLKLQRIGGSKIPLVQTGEDSFQIDVPLPEKPSLKFKREAGKVVGFFLLRPGGAQEFVQRKD